MPTEHEIEARRLMRIRVYNKYGGRCAYCGYLIDFDEFQIDHIVSKSRIKQDKEHLPQGTFTDSIENLNPACVLCNCSKHMDSVDRFRDRVENKINTLRKKEPSFRVAERYGMIRIKTKKIKFYFEKLQNNG